MPLFLVELGNAVGDGLSYIAADRDRDIGGLPSVPKMNWGGDLLNPESPFSMIHCLLNGMPLSNYDQGKAPAIAH